MQDKLVIAVYAISKNEEQFVERFCKSAKKADCTIIADTGSTDRTVQLAKQCGARVFNIHISPWRFDRARDAALALIPQNVDVCISLDLDEVLEPGWREEIEKVWIRNKTTKLKYGYQWGPGLIYPYEKIHSRKGYHWHHPCHEYPRADARLKEQFATTDKLLVSHYPDKSKSRGQYLELLELSVTEDPSSSQNMFFYGRELMFWSKFPEAIHVLQKYLDMPSSRWNNERAYAMRCIGNCLSKMSNFQEALKWYRLACTEDASVRETWCDLAQICYTLKLWPECYSSIVNAISITSKQSIYTIDPQNWAEKPFDIASIAAWNMGLKTESLNYAKLALEYKPNDKRLISNLKLIEEALKNDTKST